MTYRVALTDRGAVTVGNPLLTAPDHTQRTMLHVTNGDCAVENLRAAGMEGDIIAWRDVLHEGPVPAGLDAAGLRAVRAQFLAGGVAPDAAAIEATLVARDERLADALGHEPVILWFEHDLYDQLQLIQVLDAVDGTADVAAILPDRFLGAMKPAELAALWPARQLVRRDQVSLGRLAWDAVRAPDPEGIHALLDTHTAALPHLAAALRRHLEELPAVGDGLGRAERAALEAIAAGARTPVDAFLAAQRAEEAPFLGDTWMWERLHALGTGDARLVQTTAGAPLSPPPRYSDADDGFTEQDLELTDTGRAVLAGEADRAALLPLDRWTGGIHVTGPDPAWRWDRRAGRAVSASGGTR
jgi:hypothetical protein